MPGRPWDNPAVQLALLSIGFDRSKAAVTNAIPWSNKNSSEDKDISEDMKDCARKFWRELMQVWKPRLEVVIQLGKVAADPTIECYIEVIVELTTGRTPRTLHLMHPAAKRYHSIEQDALSRYPDVARAVQKLGFGFSPSDVSYACHAVSRWTTPGGDEPDS